VFQQCGFIWPIGVHWSQTIIVIRVYELWCAFAVRVMIPLPSYYSLLHVIFFVSEFHPRWFWCINMCSCMLDIDMFHYPVVLSCNISSHECDPCYHSCLQVYLLLRHRALLEELYLAC
jgi:hypothetical protein